MKARIVIPTATGQRISYEIAAHHGRTGGQLRIVLATNEEPFERWLFYLFRDIGAHVVTDAPEEFRRKLGLSEAEPGIVNERDVDETVQPRHSATV